MTPTGRWRARLAGARPGPSRRRPDDAAGPRALPLLRELDLIELGVHAPLPAPAVERDVDHRIETVVGGDTPVVIVAGPRLGGASHALARAARLLLGDHRVVRPDPAALAQDAAPDDPTLGTTRCVPAEQACGVVVWLDAVGPALLSALYRTAPPAGVRIFATADASLLQPDVTPDRPGPGVCVLRLPERLSVSEAGRAPAGGLPRGVGPGELVLGRDQARAMLVPAGTGPGRGRRPRRLGDAGAPARLAVLRAAVDWDRLGVPSALPTPLLARLALAYARDAAGEGHPVPDVVDLGRAVDALHRDRIRPTGAPVLRRVRLRDGVHHVPSRLLTAIADGLGEHGWTPPARFAEIVGDAIDRPEARRAVGMLAVARGFDELAGALLSPPPDPAAPGSATPDELHRLGVVALQSGRPAQARRWFAAVVHEAGDDGSWPVTRARAAFWLGLDRDADPAQRRRHLELVVRDGPARDASDAALLLAGLERDVGRFDAQRGCLRAALDAARRAQDPAREAEAALDLADLDRRSGRADRARAGYARVLELVEQDDPLATAASRAVALLESARERDEAGWEPVGASPAVEVAADRNAHDRVVPGTVPRQRLDAPGGVPSVRSRPEELTQAPPSSSPDGSPAPR